VGTRTNAKETLGNIYVFEFPKLFFYLSLMEKEILDWNKRRNFAFRLGSESNCE